jgi:FAD/FMN-containing dehydrogenase/Fe-S oxidoreductase
MEKSTEQIGNELKGLVKGDVFCDIFNRVAFSTDGSIYQIIPKCVVSPRDVDDIVSVVRYARANGISIVGRGAGSGLAGESLGEGIVINVSRYMKQILGVEDEGDVVVCEPGVVLDDLNAYLAGWGRKIGPDPSSSNRAVMGGIVANNSTGAHSLQYGYIGEYVEWVDVVLADGSIVRLENGCNPEYVLDSNAARIAEGCLQVLEDKDELIAKSVPRTKRNRCGYNIANICHDGRVDLAKLMAGSEGTLGVFTKLAIRTVALPKAKGLVQFEFESLGKMAEAIPIIVETDAAACELMGRRVLEKAREALREYRDILPVDCEAVLLVEHVGDNEAQVREKIEKTDGVVGILAQGRRIFFDEKEQGRLWKSRKDAVPLLSRQRGPASAIAFMEDVSVDNKLLGEYLAGLEKIGTKYDIEFAYYGHGGDGELHVRPYLDLSRAEDIRSMRSIAQEVFSLAWSLGGTISGEHADGLARTGFIKQQYGEEYYELLRGIKKVFDPAGLMNPGKIISDDADVMVKNLRGDNRPLPERLETNLLFGPDEFRFEIGGCDGCGVCLSLDSGTRLCPVFRAVGDELACSRGKANLLRAWVTGLIDKKDFESAEFREIISLCVNCKMCSVQCPAGVDVSKLVMEARGEIARRKGLSRAVFTLSHNRYLSMLGSLFSPLSNFVMKLGPVKWLLEKISGLDRRRGLPSFERGTFLKKGREYLASEGPVKEPVDRVAYFVDSYANYNDHELGFAVIKCLRHNQIEVILPKQRPAPVPSMVYGDVPRARRELEYSILHLAEAVHNGYKIVCSEPSAALCLRDELRLLIDSEAGRLVSAGTYELMDYLNKLNRIGRLKSGSFDGQGDFAYHMPCHLCALGTSGASIELLGNVEGIEINDINAGCCGLAGTFGMQKKNYELSEQIGEELAAVLKEMDVEYVLTECSACRMQIEHLAGKKAIHPIKVLARVYGLL